MSILQINESEIDGFVRSFIDTNQREKTFTVQNFGKSVWLLYGYL